MKKVVFLFASRTDVTAYVAKRRRGSAATTGRINLVAILKYFFELNPAGKLILLIGRNSFHVFFLDFPFRQPVSFTSVFFLRYIRSDSFSFDV